MITDRLQLNIDWHWTDWEEWEKLNIVLNRTTALTQLGQFINISTLDRLNLDLGLENQPSFSVGMKYHLSSRLILRAGVEDRKSSIPNNHLSPQIPFGDTVLIGSGMSYKFTENMTFDFSMMHFYSEEFIPAGSSDNANSTGIDNALSPFAGLDVKFKTQGTLAAFTVKAKF